MLTRKRALELGAPVPAIKERKVAPPKRKATVPRKIGTPGAKLTCTTPMRTNPACIRMVSFDLDDNIVLVFGHPHNQVQVHTKGGAFVRIIGAANDHCDPQACVFDAAGRAFVSECGAHCVKVFDKNGRYSFKIDTGCGPRGLALSRDESTLYVALMALDVVRSYNTSTGEFLRKIGDGLLRNPDGVAVLSDGRIVVSSHVGEGFVSIFPAVGTGAVTVIGVGELEVPSQIAVDGTDEVYVADSRHGRVAIYSPVDWRLKRTLGHYGAEQGEFTDPKSIAIDSTGALVVSEIHRVQLFVQRAE